MKTFVRACEVWVPSKSRTELEYYGGIYPEADNLALRRFREVSEKMVFGLEEGLPGYAWAMRAPVVLRDLRNSYFRRAAQAEAAGLTCAIAIPGFAGDYLLSVVVLFCGGDQEHFGAIELWRAQAQKLALLDGYYGDALEFELASRETGFAPGEGLPGKVWQSGMPEVMTELWFSRQFKRRADGAPIGLSKGLALPLMPGGASPAYVMTFLSSLGSPLARRFEIWTFDAAHEALVFEGGDCDLNKAFPQDYESARIAHGEGPLGRVWASGLPEANSALAQDDSVNGRSARKAGLTSLLALPVLEDGRLKAVVGFYF